jgi:hypothetical protein
MFDSTKEDLRDILRRAHEGRLQLPDFQRDYVWNDEDVQSLIASIAKGFPVGALLTLETGGEVEFKPRLLSGVPSTSEQPSELLLDGQQRITSLYQVTFGDKPVRTRNHQNKTIERYYYLDINQCVGAVADIADAIVAMPANRQRRVNFGRDVELDLSKPEFEFQHDMFPLNRVFDSKDWFYDWRDYWKPSGRDLSDIERAFDRGIVDQIARYKMPIIRLDRNNSREAICLVFEKVNVGGKKLDAFELVTAVYAADKYDLRRDWYGEPKEKQPGRRARIIGSPNPRDVVAELANTDFLQACSLLHTRATRQAKEKEGFEGRELPQVSCKREAVLALPLAAYQRYADGLEKGFIEAAGFLNEQKIIWRKDVPYPPLMIGLAAIFAIMGGDARSAGAKDKLARWFWSVVLGELYGSSTESRLARDVPEVVAWLRDPEQKVRTLEEAIFQQDRLRSLRQRLSAAYKGIHALLMKQGCRDFITGKPSDIMTFFNDHIDIHHVFPRKWCTGNGIKPEDFNSIINKTALSRQSNIAIGGDAPSVYLHRIEQRHQLSPVQLDAILETHLIDPAHLRSDDFWGYFEARKAALTTLVADAMGKPVAYEHGSNEPETDDTGTDEADDLDELVAA